MSQQIIVEGNRKVEVNRLLQLHTYEDYIEGVPTISLNQRVIENVVEKAKKECHLETVYLVEPKLTPMIVSDLFSKGEAVGKLPRITCIAELHDFSHYDDDDDALAVIWFQEDFAFLIPFDVLEQMKQVPFSKLAQKFDFF
jgi:hypothetical protein